MDFFFAFHFVILSSTPFPGISLFCLINPNSRSLFSKSMCLFGDWLLVKKKKKKSSISSTTWCGWFVIFTLFDQTKPLVCALQPSVHLSLIQVWCVIKKKERNNNYCRALHGKTHWPLFRSVSQICLEFQGFNQHNYPDNPAHHHRSTGNGWRSTDEYAKTVILIQVKLVGWSLELR